jgi:ubiquinone biosynthesis protein
MAIRRPGTTLRNLNRYREIIAVLIKYGFGEIVGRLNLYAAYRISRKFLRRTPPPATSYAVRIRLALEELGPTFVKLGQALSMRPFLIPQELVVELSRLQDEVDPIPSDQALKLIEENLGQNIPEAFKSLDPLPVASASLSQVHHGVLRDGTPVVVKIQRPHLKRIIDSDMTILRDIANLLIKHVPESIQYDPVGIIDELARMTRKEINFLYEARNIESFARNFKDDPRIFVPRVFWKHTTRCMIVMDRVEGIKINDVEALAKAGVDVSEICRIGGDMVFKMVFDHGFFHADPHPGNLFVTRAGIIAPVDYGMMGVLSTTQLNQLADILASVVSNDPAMVVYAFLKAQALPEDANLTAIEADINEMITRYHKIPLAQIDMGTITDEFFDIVRRHKIRVQSEFMTFMKALVTYEEVARKLDPNYDFIKSAEPYVRKLAVKRFKPSRIARDLRIAFSQMHDLLVKFPLELQQFMSKLNKGKLKVGLDVQGLEILILELDRSSNRLAFAIIIAAIIVGSSLIMTLDVGVRFYGVPVLGLVGYIFAGILGMGLAISILRSGKLR